MTLAAIEAPVSLVNSLKSGLLIQGKEFRAIEDTMSISLADKAERLLFGLRLISISSGIGIGCEYGASRSLGTRNSRVSGIGITSLSS